MVLLPSKPMRGEKTEHYGIHASLNAIHVGYSQIRKRLDTEALSKEQRKELEWEIALYVWILGQPDPIETANLYLKMRFESGKGTMPKREVAERLGWNVGESIPN